MPVGHKIFRIESKRDVLLWSLVITALAVAVPTTIMYIFVHRLPTRFFLQFMTPAVAIPLLIAFPISVFSLHIVRLLTATIDQVDRLVRYDPLTGLMSRTFFMDSARIRVPTGGCVMIIDADFFKHVNDTYGHDVGDEALKVIARALLQGSDPDALVGRLGGEEFAVFLPAPVDKERAELNAQRIQEAVRALGAEIGEIHLGLTVSIGVQLGEKGAPLPQLIKGADVLLYEAKRSGRDRIVLSDKLPD